jgi:predicted nucleotide-binding protein
MASPYTDRTEASTSTDRPSVFIGSSSESIEFARAARSLLNKEARITLWDELYFRPGHTTIETLINSLERFDFAILVLRPEDLVRSRDIEVLSPRDNVIFELGLFMAHLGRERTFIVSQKGAKLPTDLAGVTTLSYDFSPNVEKAAVSLNDAVQALGSVCDLIRDIIRDLGLSPTRTSKHLGQVTQRQDTLESKIRALQIVIKGIVTDFEWEKLQGLARTGPFSVRFHNDMYEELKRLDAIRYVVPLTENGINSIKHHDGTGDEFDLKEHVRITALGVEYLKLREELLES